MFTRKVMKILTKKIQFLGNIPCMILGFYALHVWFSVLVVLGGGLGDAVVGRGCI